MKFWEVLRAVDEGKTVQYCNTLGNFVTALNPKDWTANDAERKVWRIKTEPRVLHCVFYDDKVYSRTYKESEAKQYVKDNPKCSYVKFVEVMED